MAADRSDAAIVGRLIERTRLLIALSDEIPVETKLNTQAVLKMFQAALAEAGDEGDDGNHQLIAGYYAQLHRDLHEYADLDALLAAMKVFLPYV